MPGFFLRTTNSAIVLFSSLALSTPVQADDDSANRPTNFGIACFIMLGILSIAFLSALTTSRCCREEEQAERLPLTGNS